MSPCWTLTETVMKYYQLSSHGTLLDTDRYYHEILVMLPCWTLAYTIMKYFQLSSHVTLLDTDRYNHEILATF